MLAIIVIILIWIAFFFSVIWVSNDLKFEFPPSMGLQSLNNFGGSFNVLISLFTALAFAGVIISIHVQNAELKAAVSAFEGQKKALQNQEFDNKFFQMLDFFTRVKGNIKTNIDGGLYSGNDVFEPLVRKLLDSVSEEFNQDYSRDIHELFKEKFIDFNDEYEAVKYYFLNLYQILNYIKNKSSDVGLVKLYTNMLRAQLSKNELVLLAYNSIGVQAFTSGNYQNLVEEYAFFEHLKLKDFLDNNSGSMKIIVTILKKYKEGAFGDNEEFVRELNESCSHYNT